MTNLDEIYGVDQRVRAIAAHEKGLLVCLAGPGTGKTYSFLERIKALYAERRRTPEEVCYLTFIKEIARAFAADYEEKIGEAGKPRMSTLHSFACRLLRNQGFQKGYDGSLYFMDVADQKDYRSKVFLGDLLSLVQSEELQNIPSLRDVFVKKIKPAWQNSLDVWGLEEPVQAVLPMYFALSRAYRLIDWDHTVPFAYNLFEGLGALPRWISEIKHYLVDEYQDFNKAEQAFLAALGAAARSMVIAGDDDQSLYSSRGASPEGLRGLYGSDDTFRVSLVRCYRCKPGILDAANTFLSTMRPDPRPMVPKKDATGGQIDCLRFKSRQAEVKYLTGFLKNRLKKLPDDNLKPKDGIVCLFPLNKALASYIKPLMDAGVACYSRQPSMSEERAQVETALQLVSKPGQRFIERLLLERFKEIKPRHKRAMIELIIAQDISPSEAMLCLLSDGKLSEKAAAEAREFYGYCQALSSRNPDLITGKLAELLSEKVPDIRDRIEFFIQQLGETEPEETIETLCDALMPETAQPTEDPRAVLFTTMHGAKGLTRKTVVMPGLEDAWLPGEEKGEGLDEKKRLFYVALTRATDEVLITYPKNRQKGDPLNYPAAGRGEVCRFVTHSGISERYQRS